MAPQLRPSSWPCCSRHRRRPPRLRRTGAHAPQDASGPVAALLAARELHLTSSTFDVRLLGSLADIRIVQAVHNTGDTADRPRLTVAGHRRTHRAPPHQRAGRSVDLLAGVVDGCGGDAADPHDGHAQTALDEALADVLSLPAGERATIEVVAIDVLARQAGAYRLALPATVLPLGAQAVLTEHADSPWLIVVPPAETRGEAS